MIDKLEFLLALAAEKHFGHAADDCGVTQPTLSAGIKHLEDVLGALLVKRGSRFQGFTVEGERVLDWARRIVGDTRAMREEVRVLKRGELTGHLRLAVVPTALGVVSSLTVPFQAKHPRVRFTVLSRTSIQILTALETLEVDAGITYLDHEPLGRVRTVPLYSERYCLLVTADHPLADRATVTWNEVRSVPLCLLTRDMQNRRIIDGLLGGAAGESNAPSLESDSMLLLFSHVRTGAWASVMPERVVETLGHSERVRAVPIVEPAAIHTLGLVVPDRDVMAPLAAALVAEALHFAALGGAV